MAKLVTLTLGLFFFVVVFEKNDFSSFLRIVAEKNDFSSFLRIVVDVCGTNCFFLG